HRGSAGRPALADVGATRLFADGVQVELAQRLLEAPVLAPPRRAHLEPARLGPTAAARRGAFARPFRARVRRVSVCFGVECHGPALPALEFALGARAASAAIAAPDT